MVGITEDELYWFAVCVQCKMTTIQINVKLFNSPNYVLLQFLFLGLHRQTHSVQLIFSGEWQTGPLSHLLTELPGEIEIFHILRELGSPIGSKGGNGAKLILAAIVH